MKKITTIAMIAAAALAAPAMAQSTSVAGTVDVTGSVAGKCSVPSAISGTITLNELAIANGTVNSTFSNQTGGLSRSFTVNCTSANVSITVSSDALTNGTDSTTANGYTGQVHYTSTLTANKCAVVSGTGTSATWGTTVNLGELSQSNGTLRSSSGLSADFNTVANGLQNAHVVCTTTNPSITVNADPLVNTGSVPAAGSGYTNTVHFQADVQVNKVGSSQTYVNDSNTATTGPTALGARLAAAGPNVLISTSNWRTLGTDAQLVAGNYQGQIVVTITP